MSSSSKSSRAGRESSKSSEDSFAKNRSKWVDEDELIIPFHRLDSPGLPEEQQQKPRTISFKNTSSFDSAPVQLTSSSSISCATSAGECNDNSTFFNSKIPRPKTLPFERDGESHVLFDSFVSQRGRIDVDWCNPLRSRPNSANSIANVMKIVSTHTAEATQLIQKHFTICGSSSDSTKAGVRLADDLQIPFPHSTVTERSSPPLCLDSYLEPNPIDHEGIEQPYLQSLPVKHSQSSPFDGACVQLENLSKKNIDGSPRDVIRRSVSTPSMFQSSSGSAFGRVATRSSSTRASQHKSAFDPVLSVNRLKSSRGGPSLLSSASDVSSSCSVTSATLTNDTAVVVPPFRRDSRSTISTRAQVSIKNKRREKRQRDSKLLSSCKTEPKTDVTASPVDTNSSIRILKLSPVGEEKSDSKISLSSPDIDLSKRFEGIQVSDDHAHQQDYSLHKTDSSNTAVAASPAANVSPVYYKLQGEEQEISKANRNHRSSAKSKNITRTPSRSENTYMTTILHDKSPSSSVDSGSMSTSKSVNASTQSSVSYLSTGSSIAEADREVMEVNRISRRRRSGMLGDFDGSFSIHSSDSVSTHAYVALCTGSVPRDGASLPIDRFFGGKVHQGEPSASIARSSNTYSSNNSVANNTYSSISTGEEPPRIVSLSKKHDGTIVSRSHDSHPLSYSFEDVAYTKLCSDDRIDGPLHLGSKTGTILKTNKGASSPIIEGVSSPFSSVPVSPSGSSVVSTPVSPPSRFLDIHRPDDLRDASKPRVVRRFGSVGDLSSNGKDVFLSRHFSSGAVSDCFPLPLLRPRAISSQDGSRADTMLNAQLPVAVQGPDNVGEKEFQIDSYVMISPDKEE